MVMKPKNACKCMNVSYIMNAVFLLHVLATLVAILREEHYKRRIYRDITKVCEQMHRCKNSKFLTIQGLIYILKYEIHLFKLSVSNSSV